MLQKVFITKYAFTTGIIECEMYVNMETKSCYGKLSRFDFNTGFYGSDFHLTKDDAIKDCIKRKEKKIINLEKQLLKIKKLSF
ncbi:hypothetical protein [Flavobacterium sp. WC2509]|uniref:hypothetical protein n=1 Tax=Flavobacterium sp. WC2509 TaxID=3461406 RepID=UPI0040443873